MPSFADVTALSLQDLEFPLNLFTAGNICHPYLSLPYLGNYTKDLDLFLLQELKVKVNAFD